MYVPERSGRIAAPFVNWSKRVNVELEFQTDTITARDGTEQRLANRQDPRIEVKFNTLLERGGITRLMSDLEESQNVPFSLPMPWRLVWLTAPASAGDTAIEVSEVPFWLQAGAELVVASDTAQQVATVVSVAGTTVTLDDVLDFDYGPGAKASLAYDARFQDEIDFKAETATTWSGTLSMQVDPGQPWAFADETPDTFEGVEVFLRKPNWATAPKITLLETRETVDYGRGVIETDSPTRRLQERVQLRYLGSDRDTLESLFAFFCRMKGKRGSFYMPTWQRDLTAKASPAANQIEVAGVDANYGFEGSDTFNTVIAFWDDGTYQINRVTSYALSGENTVITFTDNWSKTVTPSTRLSWCPRWRLAADRLDVQFYTASVCDLTLPCLTLPS